MLQNLGSAAGAHKIATAARIALALVDSFASLLDLSKSTSATFIRPMLMELLRFSWSIFWVVVAHLAFYFVFLSVVFLLQFSTKSTRSCRNVEPLMYSTRSYAWIITDPSGYKVRSS